jgi:hypothetical protein
LAKIIVSFDSEQQASQFVDRLAGENLSETRARVLSSTEHLSYPKNDSTAPMITPQMGSVEVRPSESPVLPQPENENMAEQASASIPLTGVEGVQVMIEVDDEHEGAVHRLMREMSSGGKNQTKENKP